MSSRPTGPPWAHGPAELQEDSPGLPSVPSLRSRRWSRGTSSRLHSESESATDDEETGRKEPLSGVKNERPINSQRVANTNGKACVDEEAASSSAHDHPIRAQPHPVQDNSQNQEGLTESEYGSLLKIRAARIEARQSESKQTSTSQSAHKVSRATGVQLNTPHSQNMRARRLRYEKGSYDTISMGPPQQSPLLDIRDSEESTRHETEAVNSKASSVFTLEDVESDSNYDLRLEVVLPDQYEDPEVEGEEKGIDMLSFDMLSHDSYKKRRRQRLRNTYLKRPVVYMRTHSSDSEGELEKDRYPIGRRLRRRIAESESLAVTSSSERDGEEEENCRYSDQDLFRGRASGAYRLRRRVRGPASSVSSATSEDKDSLQSDSDQYSGIQSLMTGYRDENGKIRKRVGHRRQFTEREHNQQDVQLKEGTHGMEMERDTIRDNPISPLLQDYSETILSANKMVTTVDPRMFEAAASRNGYEEPHLQQALASSNHLLYEADNGMQPFQYQHQDDDSCSAMSSYANSVFSVQSLETSATDLSKGSKYSALQIATATLELVLIFHNDPVLVPLYRKALGSDSVGAERFQRNLRRLFKAYAKQLSDEASDGLEYLASRLVATKARYLAQSIVEKFQGTIKPNKAKEVQEESSEDEKTRPVDEQIFDDLIQFREFLLRGEAFQTLRAQVRRFVLPHEVHGSVEHWKVPMINLVLPLRYCPAILRKHMQIRPSDNNRPCHDVGSNWTKFELMYGQCHSIRSRLQDYWKAVNIATGQREPPLSNNAQRLRWTCKCGEAFFGDFVELRPGGIAELKRHMIASSGVEFVPECDSEGKSTQGHTYRHPFLWVLSGVGKYVGSLRQSALRPPTLPQSNAGPVAMTQTIGNNLRQRTLYMMACMHKGRNRKNLYQDQIDDVKTDRHLFRFLRNQYVTRRGRLRTLLTLHGVQGIFFVKFRLPVGGSIEIRHHDSCCRNYPCECLPPESKVEPAPQAEYRCRPIPPPTFPPVLPEYLMHLFTSPCCINEHDTWILDQLPKRTCGELHGKVGQPAEGWGIYYREGWDRDKITLICFMLFIMGSMLFGILWSRFRMDVQGAFAVSAYMVTACGILVTFIATKVEKP